MAKDSEKQSSGLSKTAEKTADVMMTLAKLLLVFLFFNLAAQIAFYLVYVYILHPGI